MSSLATVIGAVPGAIPPMMGWSAVTGALGPAAWVLFAILFLWQMPHFLAIAWLCREDYARAGFPMLTVRDTGGRRTARQVVLYGAALVPVSPPARRCSASWAASTSPAPSPSGSSTSPPASPSRGGARSPAPAG